MGTSTRIRRHGGYGCWSPVQNYISTRSCRIGLLPQQEPRQRLMAVLIPPSPGERSRCLAPVSTKRPFGVSGCFTMLNRPAGPRHNRPHAKQPLCERPFSRRASGPLCRPSGYNLSLRPTLVLLFPCRGHAWRSDAWRRWLWASSVREEPATPKPS